MREGLWPELLQDVFVTILQSASQYSETVERMVNIDSAIHPFFADTEEHLQFCLITAEIFRDRLPQTNTELTNEKDGESDNEFESADPQNTILRCSTVFILSRCFLSIGRALHDRYPLETLIRYIFILTLRWYWVQAKDTPNQDSALHLYRECLRIFNETGQDSVTLIHWFVIEFIIAKTIK